jgi:hypothetical protein
VPVPECPADSHAGVPAHDSVPGCEFGVVLKRRGDQNPVDRIAVDVGKERRTGSNMRRERVQDQPGLVDRLGEKVVDREGKLNSAPFCQPRDFEARDRRNSDNTAMMNSAMTMSRVLVCWLFCWDFSGRHMRQF